MTRKHAIFLMTALAASVSAAFAQEASSPFSGTVTVTGLSTHVDSQNRFRFEEYRDLDSGLTAGMNVRAEKDGWWHRLFGENLGRDDQFIELKGGRYGLFKYTVYNDDIVHNLTYGAITPFSGVGTNNLTFNGTAPPSTSLATWNSFDYGVKHKNVGAILEGQLGAESPFFVRGTFNRKRSTGIKPLGEPGTSPGGPAYELPAPIDWTTTDFSGEVGYATRTAHLSFSALWSKFEDNNDFLFWRSPVIASGPNIEQSTIAADNKLHRFAVNGMIKQLPFDSSLAVRATYTKLTNSIPVGTTYLTISGTTATMRQANPSDSTFDGEVVNKSVSVALNSSPYRTFNTKVYYNWYKRENNSTEIVFTPGVPSGTSGPCDTTAAGAALPTCTTEFFHFRRSNYGVEGQWRVFPQNKLTLGVDYTDTERERVDFDRSRETKLFAEWKTGSFEVADVRVKYQHLNRSSDFLLANSTDVFSRYLLRFDAAPLSRNLVKVTVDASPMELLDVGVEFAYKRNKYGDTLLGRNKDTRQEWALSASYGPPNLRFSAFADWEHTQYDSTHWVGATTTFPNSNAAGTTFLWTSDVKDTNYLVGLAGEWTANERLRVVGSAIWQKADGSVDFEAFSTTRIPQNITRYDNFSKKSVNLRAIYALTREVGVSLGAAYEKYDYSDIQMDNYIYAIRTGANQNYLSGAYAFPNYTARIFYATVTYRF